MTHKLSQYEQQIDALSNRRDRDLEEMHEAYQKHWYTTVEHAGKTSAGKVSNATEHGSLTVVNESHRSEELLLQRAIAAETSLDQMQLKYDTLLRSNHDMSMQAKEYQGLVEQQRFQLDDATQEREYLESELLRASEDYDLLEKSTCTPVAVLYTCISQFVTVTRYAMLMTTIYLPTMSYRIGGGAEAM
jgi:hypothetical protein